MNYTENVQNLINERNNQNKRIEQLVLEIEQLRTELNTKNNIINELEKILSTEMYKDIAVAKCLDKLKELKDSD